MYDISRRVMNFTFRVNEKEFSEIIDKLIKEVKEESKDGYKNMNGIDTILFKMVRDISLVSLKEKLINELYVEVLEDE